MKLHLIVETGKAASPYTRDWIRVTSDDLGDGLHIHLDRYDEPVPIFDAVLADWYKTEKGNPPQYRFTNDSYEWYQITLNTTGLDPYHLPTMWQKYPKAGIIDRKRLSSIIGRWLGEIGPRAVLTVSSHDPRKEQIYLKILSRAGITCQEVSLSGPYSAHAIGWDWSKVPHSVSSGR